MGRSLVFLLGWIIFSSPLLHAEETIQLENSWQKAIRNNVAKELWRISSLPDGATRSVENGKTILMAAAGAGDQALVLRLLELGSDINANNHHGGTALMYASSQGHYQVVFELLEAGAYVDQQADNGWTAIQLAAAKGFADLISLLLEYDADPNIPDVFGHNALLRAIANGKPDSVKALLDNSVIQLGSRNSQGETAASMAIQLGHCGILQQLSNAYSEQDLESLSILLRSKIKKLC